jgi:hypothetical protein
MPILTFSFGLQYMDKAVLNSASVFGIIKDLVKLSILRLARLR